MRMMIIEARTTAETTYTTMSIRIEANIPSVVVELIGLITTAKLVKWLHSHCVMVAFEETKRQPSSDLEDCLVIFPVGIIYLGSTILP